VRSSAGGKKFYEEKKGAPNASARRHGDRSLLTKGGGRSLKGGWLPRGRGEAAWKNLVSESPRGRGKGGVRHSFVKKGEKFSGGKKRTILSRGERKIATEERERTSGRWVKR